MKFSEKLKRLIEDTRASQEIVADVAGVSQNLVSRWVTGKSVPDVYEALAVARHFGVSLLYLADDEMSEDVGEGNSGSSLTPDQVYILTLIGDLGISRAETARRLAVLNEAQSPPKVEPAPTRPSHESTA